MGAVIIEVAYIIEVKNFQSLLSFKKLVPVILLIGAIPIVINNIKKVDKWLLFITVWKREMKTFPFPFNKFIYSYE